MKIEKVILILGAGALENGYIFGFKLPGVFLWPWGPKYKQFLNFVGVKFQPLNKLKCETLATLAKAAEIFHKEKDCIIFITDSFSPDRKIAGVKQIGEMMRAELVRRGIPAEKIIISAKASVETRGKVESFFAYLETYENTIFEVFLPVPRYYKRRAIGKIMGQLEKIEIMVRINFYQVKVPFRCWFSEYFFNHLTEPWKRIKSARNTDAYIKEERKARESYTIKK